MSCPTQSADTLQMIKYTWWVNKINKGTTALTAGKLKRDKQKHQKHEFTKWSTTLLLRTSLIQIRGITDCAPFANVQYMRMLLNKSSHVACSHEIYWKHYNATSALCDHRTFLVNQLLVGTKINTFMFSFLNGSGQLIGLQNRCQPKSFESGLYN